MNNTLVVLLNQIIENEISGICKDYKISLKKAEQIIIDLFNNSLVLNKKIEEKGIYDFDKVKRFKEYKVFIKTKDGRLRRLTPLELERLNMFLIFLGIKKWM